MQNNSFFLPGEFSQEYKNIRDDFFYENEKKYLEELWLKYQKYSDHGFKKRFPHELHQRFWEMYSACAFLENGIQIQKESNKGFDFYFCINGKKIFVEATTVSPGDSDYRVSEPNEYNIWEPTKRIKLRYTNALESKFKKANEDLKKYYNNEGHYILAINIYEVNWPQSNEEICRDFKYLLGLDNGAENHRTLTFRGKIIPIDYFKKSEFSNCLAVITSQVNIVNFPPKIGDDFIIFLSPNSNTNFPETLFAFFKQVK